MINNNCSKTYISPINSKNDALSSSIIKFIEVLLAPSVYPEAFGLMVTEAQLRGIPVVSTNICGLAEANQVPQTQVPEIPLVFDPSTLGSRCGNSIFFVNFFSPDLVGWKLVENVKCGDSFGF